MGEAEGVAGRAVTSVPAGAILPNPFVTPGAIDPKITLSDICNGTTRSRRRVTAATRAKVLHDYNMPAVTTDDYELDHLVPLAIGGTNAAANLWPQPAPDYHLKDVLEVEMQRRACVAYRTLLPSEAAQVLRQEQRDIADDWIGAVRRYIAP